MRTADAREYVTGTPEELAAYFTKLNSRGELSGLRMISERADGTREVEVIRTVQLALPAAPTAHPAAPLPPATLPWYQDFRGAAVASLTTGGLAAAALIALVEAIR